MLETIEKINGVLNNFIWGVPAMVCIIGAVSIMSDKDANIFWHIIQKHFKLPDTFADIEKVEPDETDLIMLKEIENNPDCHEFISQEELMKELNM